jgi:hypothetical protein
MNAPRKKKDLAERAPAKPAEPPPKTTVTAAPSSSSDVLARLDAIDKTIAGSEARIERLTSRLARAFAVVSAAAEVTGSSIPTEVSLQRLRERCVEFAFDREMPRPWAEWQDVTSYSRGERGRKPPNIWQLKGHLDVQVHRYIHCEGWFLSCRALNLQVEQLTALDADGAKTEALDRVRTILLQLFTCLPVSTKPTTTP